MLDDEAASSPVSMVASAGPGSGAARFLGDDGYWRRRGHSLLVSGWCTYAGVSCRGGCCRRWMPSLLAVRSTASRRVPVAAIHTHGASSPLDCSCDAPWILMFPESAYPSTSLNEHTVSLLIFSRVPAKLRNATVSASSRHRRMQQELVPEATTEKDGYSLYCEDDIGMSSATKRCEASSEATIARMKTVSNRKLRLGIVTLAGHHRATRARCRRPRNDSRFAVRCRRPFNEALKTTENVVETEESSHGTQW